MPHTMSTTAATNLTRAEAQERSALLRTGHYAVDLDLSTADDPHTAVFGTRTTADFTATADGETFIDLIAASVESITINDVPLDPAVAFDGARIAFPVREGANRLIVLAQGLYSRSGEGLHRFTDPADGNTYLYTQYEPTDARRVAAVFDQPDLKAAYTFQVLAPAGWTVLSNTAAEQVTEIPAGASGTDPARGPMRLHRFARTLPVSSYLTCVCAGPYASATGTHRHPSTGEEIALGVYARQSLASHMDADEILTVTTQGLDFFHELFGIPYPWGKYDQIFVPEYNLGAMENPGLVTFTDSYLHRDRATRADREARANTVLHEMAHMWFGDYVTMRWWDDLWLKESFADYMGGLALAEATEFSDGWVTFALRRKDWAYRQDQYPTSHPVVADIPDVEAAKLNFDGITYAKGASVLKALVAYVGCEAFIAGSRAYFTAHAFGNAQLEDFLAALDAEAPGRDVRAWAAAWLQTRGTSELRLEVEEGGAGGEASAAEAQAVISSARLTQRDTFADQETAPILRPHRLTLAAFDFAPGAGAEAGAEGGVRKDGGPAEADGVHETGAHEAENGEPDGTGLGDRLVLTRTWDVELTGASAPLPQLEGLPRPALLLLNHGDSDFAKIRLDPRSTETAISGVGRLEDSMDRALVLSALGNAARDGELPVPAYLQAAAGVLAVEEHPGILASVMATVGTALSQWVPVEERLDAVAAMLESALEAVSTVPEGSDRQVSLARFALALTARTTGAVVANRITHAGRAFASHVLTVEVGDPLTETAPGLLADHALRWEALRTLTILGWAEPEDIEAEAALDRSGSGAVNAASVRAARPLAIARHRAWDEATDDLSLSNEFISARISGLTAPAPHPILEDRVTEYFEQLERWWASRPIEISRRLVVGLYPRWSVRPRRVAAKTDEWLSAHPDAPTAQRRLLIEVRDDLARAMRLRGES
ncbi:aminopeptidase N [Brevibacterium album]|uniref:aminopeptidase N n=1 Tax=Brevibacterium album TaxID=417948 RepID=UPI00040EAAA9|nr:aminopeptidase N [Brevibacterium album]